MCVLQLMLVLFWSFFLSFFIQPRISTPTHTYTHTYTYTRNHLHPIHIPPANPHNRLLSKACHVRARTSAPIHVVLCLLSASTRAPMYHSNDYISIYYHPHLSAPLFGVCVTLRTPPCILSDLIVYTSCVDYEQLELYLDDKIL